MEHIYDVVVIGGGPAGYGAALYCVREGLDTLVLEKLSAGGQMAMSEQIDNYPGFNDGIEGYELAERMLQGAERFGAKTELAEVRSVELEGEVKRLETSEGDFFARTVLIATGAAPRRLGLPHEEELVGRGVNYCAACDGMAYRGKTVALVGGGNSAVVDALQLSKLCKRVILIHRRDSLRAEKVYDRALARAENIEYRWNSAVSELLFDKRLTGLRLRDVHSGEESELQVDGLFVSVGRTPSTELFRGKLELDPAGYLAADETTRTKLPGVFAVGDVRTKPLRQVVTAVADGATAAHFAAEYLSK